MREGLFALYRVSLCAGGFFRVFSFCNSVHLCGEVLLRKAQSGQRRLGSLFYGFLALVFYHLHAHFSPRLWRWQVRPHSLPVLFFL